MDYLSRNSRTRSRIPTRFIGLFQNEQLNTRTKLLYSKNYRDRVFMFDFSKGYDKENTIVGDVSVEDRLVINYKFNIKMWPPDSLNFLGDSVVSDVEVVGEYFVQLISTKQQAWVCFYSYNLRLEKLMKNKCTLLPGFI